MSHYDDYIDEQNFKNRLATARSERTKSQEALTFIRTNYAKITSGVPYTVTHLKNIEMYHKSIVYDTAWVESYADS